MQDGLIQPWGKYKVFGAVRFVVVARKCRISKNAAIQSN
jgi:hypothetical protein